MKSSQSSADTISTDESVFVVVHTAVEPIVNLCFPLCSYQGNSEEVGCYVAGHPLSKGNCYFEVRRTDSDAPLCHCD